MSDKKISDLVELTSFAADDVLPVVDADANATKRVTYDTLATEVRTESEPLSATTVTASGDVSADTATIAGDITSNGETVFHRGNVVGTVSQSGGTPTGAVVERDSNANGEYVKFADGTLICYGEIIAPKNTGKGEKTKDFTFPEEFANTNRKVFCNFRFSVHENMRRMKFLHPNDDGEVTTIAQTIGWEEGAWSDRDFGRDQPIMVQAIGRWY